MENMQYLKYFSIFESTVAWWTDEKYLLLPSRVCSNKVNFATD